MSRFRGGWWLLVLALGGCATTGGDPGDPVEPVNRAVFAFNDGLDKALLQPAVSAYTAVVPGRVRESVFNFFENLAYPTVAANAVLQGKFTQGIEDAARFVFNTTLGIGGLFDVATGFGLERHDEDFGQTLGAWGMGEGAYLELPLLGPSTLRDALGLPVDAYTSILSSFDMDVELPLKSVQVVESRARVDSAVRLRDEGALDPYIFQREAYIQHRRNLVHDGNPPPEDYDLGDGG